MLFFKYYLVDVYLLSSHSFLSSFLYLLFKTLPRSSSPLFLVSGVWQFWVLSVDKDGWKEALLADEEISLMQMAVLNLFTEVLGRCDYIIGFYGTLESPIIIAGEDRLSLD